MSAVLNATPWKDTKRLAWVGGALIFLLPPAAVLLWRLHDAVLWLFAPLVVLYAVIPLFDLLVGEDEANPPDEAMPALAKDAYYRWVLMAAVPVYLVSWAFMAYAFVAWADGWAAQLGIALGMGMLCGLAINVAHELGHQTDPLERFLARLTLAPGAYGHFFVEHNRGHHVRVATPEDPASSRFNESFWAFLPRCVVGSVRSAWALEAKRMAFEKRSFWSWRNHLLQSWAMTAAIWAIAAVLLGPAVLLAVVFAAAYGGSLLEVVNYLEHYGLKRERRADGQGYERCQPKHSWNSNHIATNVLLYHLQRHSDHHANPTRSYQTLRNFDELPRLPSGYAAMILVAYLPPLWFRMMNPRVLAHVGHNEAMLNRG